MRHDQSRGGSILLAVCPVSRSFRTVRNHLFQLLLPFCTHPYDVWHMLYDTWYLTLCIHPYGIWCYARTHTIYGIWYMTRCGYTYMAHGKASAFLLFTLHIRMYMCTYVRTYARIYVCMHECVLMYVCVCVYVCTVCIFVYIYMYLRLYVSANQDRGKAHDAPRSIKRG